MTVYIGNQVQAEFGVWPWDNNPTSFSYQWQDSADGVVLSGNITGETHSDYVADVSETGRYVRAAVTASNSGGNSSVAFTDWVGPIGVAPPPPGSTFPITVPVLLSGCAPPPEFPRHFDSSADTAGYY